MAGTKVNYSEELVARIKAMYEEIGHDNTRLQEIADATGKPVRSIRAKLVREGVYIASEKAAKAPKEEGPTKKELMQVLSSLVPDFDTDGLMAANKAAIEAVIGLARKAREADESAEEAADDFEEVTSDAA